MRNHVKRGQDQAARIAKKKGAETRRRLRAEYNAWFRQTFTPDEIVALSNGNASPELNDRALTSGWLRWMELAPAFMSPAEIAFINRSGNWIGKETEK